MTPMRALRISGKQTVLRVRSGLSVMPELAPADLFQRPPQVAIELHRVHRDVEVASKIREVHVYGSECSILPLIPTAFAERRGGSAHAEMLAVKDKL